MHGRDYIVTHQGACGITFNVAASAVTAERAVRLGGRGAAGWKEGPAAAGRRGSLAVRPGAT